MTQGEFYIALITGGFAVLSALLAGFFSYKAAKYQSKRDAEHIEKQNREEEKRRQNEEQKRNKEKALLAVSIINQFLLNEIKCNLKKFESLTHYLKQEKKTWPTITLRPLQFDEYDRVKYDLINKDTLIVELTVDIYQMFYLLESVDKLNDLNENQIIFVQANLENANYLISELEGKYALTAQKEIALKHLYKMYDEMRDRYN